MIPGEYFLHAAPVHANVGRTTVDIDVSNCGDRPIQVGSHIHFFEVNKALDFPRRLAFGMHLNIAAGTAVRFEPGDTKRVTLVAFAGTRVVYGINNLCDGPLTNEHCAVALERARAGGFRGTAAEGVGQ